MSVSELQDGTAVDIVLLVREASAATTRAGKPYLRLKLGDRSGVVAGVRWEAREADIEQARPGTIIRLRGRYGVSPRYGPQIGIEAMRTALEGEYRLDDLLDAPPRSAEQMEADLRELVATVRNPHLGALLDRVLGEHSELWPRYRDAPAAKFFHQAYRHGLLEHSLSVAQAVSAISATFGGIDRDVAVTGALLHDIGKLDAYSAEPLNIDLTDRGRLQGEIPLGYYRIRRLIEDIDGFPPELAQALLHILLAHHGTLEHGSPVVPATREATLVHMIDNLGGKLGSFDRIEKALPAGEEWSPFDRALGGGAWFAERAAAA